MRSNKGFTLIELLVVISIIALLIGILLPALGAARATARRMQSNTQIRGIHQAMVMYADGNRTYFPGINGSGNLADNPVNSDYFSEHADDDDSGHWPSVRYAYLLNGDFFTPDYMISPADSGKTEAQPDDSATDSDGINYTHFSYALLDLNQMEDGASYTAPQRTREWSSTLNTEAIVVSDRAKGEADDIFSVHTREGSDDWRGGVARNDNSVSFETTHIHRTRYGNGPLNYEEGSGTDNLFLNSNGDSDVNDNHSTGADAYMRYEDDSDPVIFDEN